MNIVAYATLLLNSCTVQIDNVMRLNGVDGLLYRYKVDKIDEVEDVGVFFDVDLEDTSVKKDNPKQPEIGPSSEPKQRVDIDRILHVSLGEEKHYENSEIHINAFVKCEGSMEFKNCIIYYNEVAGGFNITLADNASMVIENCKIICKGTAERSFIECGSNQIISVKYSCLKDCVRFLNASSAKISFERCSFENCIQDVVDCRGDFLMRDCMYLRTSVIVPFIDKSRWSDSFYCIGGKCIVENCRFERLGEIDEKFKNILFALSCDEISVINCEFYNLGHALHGSVYGAEKQKKSVSNTKFISCQDVLEGNLYLDNCIFEKCSNVCSLSSTQEFFYCQFVDIAGVIANYAKADFNYCEFFNINDSSITKDYDHGDVFVLDEGSSLDHCIFDGISLEKSLLIKTFYLCKKEYAVSVKNSVFKHCYAKKGYLIERSKTIEGVIWDTHVKTPVSVYNCTGLDNIRSAPIPHVEAAIRTINKITGAIIGLRKNNY